MSFDPRLIEIVAADLVAIASELGGLDEALANRVKNNANLLLSSSHQVHSGAADQFWTGTHQMANAELANHHHQIKPNQGCLSVADQFWTDTHPASDRSVADLFGTDTSIKNTHLPKTKQTLNSKFTGTSIDGPTGPTDEKKPQSNIIGNVMVNKNGGHLQIDVKRPLKPMNRTALLEKFDSPMSSRIPVLSGAVGPADSPKSSLKIRDRENKIISRLLCTLARNLELPGFDAAKPKEPIKLLIKKAELVGCKSFYTSSIVSSSGNASNQLNPTKEILLKHLDRESRSVYYKLLSMDKDKFSPLENFPALKLGKKPFCAQDLPRLKRMITLKLEEPMQYLNLHETLENSDDLQNGILNIEKITCNNNGKAIIICEDANQKELVKNLLVKASFDPRNAKIKNLSFAIFGIAKTKKSEDILSELMKRDKRFEKKDEFRIKERFPIDQANDAVVLSCGVNIIPKITKKPFIFLGTKRYKLNNFVDLIQCFKCAEFGHTAAKCESKFICCPNCASEHSLDNCTIDYKPKCGNCSSAKVGMSEHSSWDVRCPYRYLWIRKQKEWSEQSRL